MPKLYDFLGLKIYFWTSDGSEPIHVHVSRGKPSPSSTKIWLTSRGGCAVAKDTGELTRRELSLVCDFIVSEHAEICAAWAEKLRSEVRFYC